jgi:hypothetical protein
MGFGSGWGLVLRDEGRRSARRPGLGHVDDDIVAIENDYDHVNAEEAGEGFEDLDREVVPEN